jgi:FdhD protein
MAFSKEAAISRVTAWKVTGPEIEAHREKVAVESLLSLWINGLKAYNLLYLPGQEIELSLGFLLTGGIIETTADILEMRLAPPDQVTGKFYAQVQIRLAKTFNNRQDLSATLAEAVLSGAGAAGKPLVAEQFRRFPEQQVKMSAAAISTLMAGLPKRQEIFRQTGATHAIFLADTGGGVVLGAEDVGRHNAFDKVIGQALMKNLPMGDKIALLSGRASFEMVLKAARAGIPIMSSVSAPTSLAVKLADLQGITLIGFAREERLNIYTHPHRLADLGDSSYPYIGINFVWASAGKNLPPEIGLAASGSYLTLQRLLRLLPPYYIPPPLAESASVAVYLSTPSPRSEKGPPGLPAGLGGTFSEPRFFYFCVSGQTGRVSGRDYHKCHAFD